MDHISRVLPRVLQKRGIKDHAQAALVVHRAQHWLDDRFPELKGTVHATVLQDGALVIECDHPIALQECRSASEDLRSFLQRETVDIKDVRILRTKAAR